MPTTTNNLEHVALDGPVGLPMAIGVALVLLGLFTWSLTRERRILGSRFTVLFWVLRATALGVAIWMLMGPTRVLVEVSTTRKSVAVLMTRHPVTVRADALAVEVLRTIGQNRIDDIVVLDAEGKPVGLIDTQDLARLKIV